MAEYLHVWRANVAEGSVERLLELEPAAIAEAQQLCPELLGADLVRLEDGTWLHVLRWSCEDGEERLMADPSPNIELLDRLVDDPSPYVRRSVANHLNDIAKDHPDIALDLAHRWLLRGDGAVGAVRHGLRTLVKRGDPNALELLGVTPDADIRLRRSPSTETP